MAYHATKQSDGQAKAKKETKRRKPPRRGLGIWLWILRIILGLDGDFPESPDD